MDMSPVRVPQGFYTLYTGLWNLSFVLSINIITSRFDSESLPEDIHSHVPSCPTMRIFALEICYLYCFMDSNRFPILSLWKRNCRVLFMGMESCVAKRTSGVQWPLAVLLRFCTFFTHVESLIVQDLLTFCVSPGTPCPPLQPTVSKHLAWWLWTECWLVWRLNERCIQITSHTSEIRMNMIENSRTAGDWFQRGDALSPATGATRIRMYLVISTQVYKY